MEFRPHRSLPVILMSLVLACLVSISVEAKKPAKPPPGGGSADPQLTFVDSRSRVLVSNEDASNQAAIYRNRSAYLRSPRIAPRSDSSEGSVYFVETDPPGLPRIRRTRFEVLDGEISSTSTETIFEGEMSWYIALSQDGERVAFKISIWDAGEFLGNVIHELQPALCPTLPCTLADTVELYSSVGPPAGAQKEVIAVAYSANGLALFFSEYDYATDGFEIRRIDLSPGSGLQVETVLPEPGGDPLPEVLHLEASRSDRTGLEARLLHGDWDHLYLSDTLLGGTPELLGPGHAGRWSQDDSRVLFLDWWRTPRDCCSGEVKRMDLTTHPYTVEDLLKYAIQPDWAPPPY